MTDRSTSGPSTTSGTAAGGTTGSSSTPATGADGGGSWGAVPQAFRHSRAKWPVCLQRKQAPLLGHTVALCPRSLQILQIRGCPRNQSLQIVPAIKRLRGGSRSNSTLTRRVPVATPGCPEKCCIRTLLTSPYWARASLTASFDCSNGRLRTWTTVLGGSQSP